MKNGLLILTSFLIFIAACDAPHYIVIKAARKKNVSLTVCARNNIISLYREDTVERIRLHVPTDSFPRRRILLEFGFGPWSPVTITSIANRIDSIVFNNSNGRLVLQDKNTIVTYLTEHQHRYRMKIKAK